MLGPMRIEIRNLIVKGDRVMADGPQPSVAPDGYEISPEFQLILFWWHDDEPAPRCHEHCQGPGCDYKRADQEMMGGEAGNPGG